MQPSSPDVCYFCRTLFHKDNGFARLARLDTILWAGWSRGIGNWNRCISIDGTTTRKTIFISLLLIDSFRIQRELDPFGVEEKSYNFLEFFGNFYEKFVKSDSRDYLLFRSVRNSMNIVKPGLGVGMHPPLNPGHISGRYSPPYRPPERMRCMTSSSVCSITNYKNCKQNEMISLNFSLPDLGIMNKWKHSLLSLFNHLY